MQWECGAGAEGKGQADDGQQRGDEENRLLQGSGRYHGYSVPTIISHPAVVLLQPRATPARVTVAAVVATILPDLDTIGFAYGIPYGSPYGHRGFTHSIAFAVAGAALLTLATRRDGRTFALLFLCALSHPLLDAFTNGGRGVALFWPFSDHRYFAPWRPIEVSPIGRLSLSVLWSEAKWVWLPAIAIRALRLRGRRPQASAAAPAGRN